MVTKRDNFELDFSLDPVYEYRDPRGFRGSRVFQPSSSRVPLYGPPVAAPAAGLSTPLLLAAVAITIFVLGAVIGIPLAVIFGIVLPNSSTVETPTGSSTTQPPVPQVPDPVIPNTVAPPPRTLLVRCPDDINTNTQQGEAYAIVTWDPPMVLSETEGQVQMMSTVQPNTRFPVGFQRVQYTVTDTASNTGSCSFQVTVVDNEPPSIQCPANRTVPTDPLSISARVFWDPPTITENAGIVTVRQQTDQSGDQFHVGPHVVTIVIHDEANNENRCSFSIVVEDREKPRVTCPAGIVAFTNDPLVGMARATWSAPLVRDNSLGQLVAICTPASGSAFPFGNTPVNCMATDAAGNPGSCMFMVMIRFNDTLPPEFVSCPSDIVVNATQDSASAFVTWIPPNATDNSLQIPTINANTQPDRQYEIGSYQVIYTAMDVEGNSAQCSFQVEVLDSQDPSIMCPDDLIRNTDRGRPDATVILPAPTTSDNSVTSLTVTTNPPGSPVLRIGNHTVTYTVADDSGNTASCDVTVMIRDGEKPTFTRPANTSLPAGPGVSFAIVSLPPPTNLMDNSGEIVRVSTTPANNTMLPIGENIIVYTVSDAFGLSVSFSIQVIVLDNENPSIMCPDDLIQNTDSGRANATVTLPAATTSDNSVTSLTVTTNPSGSPVLGIGNHTVTYTVTDDSGNPASCNITVTVKDEEDPSIMCPDDLIWNTDSGRANATVTLPAATTSDNSMTSLTVTTNPSGSPVLGIGNHTVTYTVTDDSGNPASCNITVTVRDMELPSFTRPSNFSLPTVSGESFAIVRLPLLTDVTDNSGQDVNVTTSVSDNSQLPIGIHDIVYTVTDVSGNVVTFTITVTVVDEEAPRFTPPSNFTIPAIGGESFAIVRLPLPTNVVDNSGDAVNITTSPANNSMLDIGPHSIVYTLTDSMGRFSMFTIIVTVEDKEDPSIMCPDDIIQDNDRGQGYATITVPDPATVSVSDNSEGQLTTRAELNGTHQFRIGNHTIMYNVTDESGNSMSCTLNITVNDVENPTFTRPVNTSFSAGLGVSFAIAVLPLPTNLMDNSGEVVRVSTTPANNTMLPIGEHIIVYTVSDAFGLSVSFSIQVIVLDKEPPNLMCPANITRQTDTDQSFATETYSPLVLSDNDGNMPNLTSDHPGNTFAIGETIVTLTARDLSGNEINCSFSITVEDSQPPALECPSEVIVYTDQLVFPLQFSGYASWTINVTDNSQMPFLRNESTHQSGSFFNTSITNVTHTVVDAYNNVNQCSFCVIIMGFVNTICNPSGSDLDLSELAGRGVRYHLLSPNFNISETYPSNSDCTWRISAPAGTHIRVRFEAFDTEFGKDVLTLGNGLDFALINTSLARYSGKLVELVNGTHHTKDRVYGNAIWLHFVSDQTFVQKFFGFWLQFDYISDPRSLYPASHSFCSEFDGFPCLDGSCVNISKRCDGVANDCPSNEDETDCPQVCSGSLPPQSANFTADNGVYYTDIVSDNYPGEYRPCNMRWNIDSNFVQSVRIVVMDIQIGAQDRLYIVDQGTGNAVTSDIDSLVSLHITSSTSLAVIFESSGGAQHGFWIRVWRYIPGRNDFLDFPAYCEKALHGVLCGTGTSGIATCFPDTERCDGDTDCLTFNNDERDCQAASYDCGNTTISLGNQGSMYHLTSVNYPADFLYGISCRYFVTTAAARILASFRDVEIPATTSNDYLRIGNGDTVSDATEILRVTGVFLPQDVVSEGNRLWFEFISDSSVNSRGFWIVLVAQG